MQASPDTHQRLKELIARIEIEQNPRHFSALVEELNRLLETSSQVEMPPTSHP